MKAKKNSVKLTIAIIGTLLLLGVSSAQAATVIFQGDTATGIENLDVNGISYDVEFVNKTGNAVYGNPPVFDFDNENDADAALEAVIAALNGEPAVTNVGPSSDDDFLIGYEEDERFNRRFIDARQGRYIDGTWFNTGFDTEEATDVESYAVFTKVSDPGDPGDLPSAETSEVLANMNSAAAVANLALALADPQYYALASLYAQTATDNAQNAYDKASAEQDDNTSFWGIYGVQYVQSELDSRAQAQTYIDQAVQSANSGDLVAAESYAINALSALATADLYNGTAIWCLTNESAGAN